LPGTVQENLKNGSDSTSIKKLADRVDKKSEQWLWTCEFRKWVEIFYELFGDDPKLKMSRAEMMSKESLFVQSLMDDDYEDGEEEAEGVEEEEGDGNYEDSLFIFTLGKEFFYAFQTEIDSSVEVLNEMDHSFWTSSAYDMEIRMPGRIIASNGYAEIESDTIGEESILWTVQGEYFLTENYDMWVESKVNNYFIWIITAVFILFVAAGFVVRGRNL